MTRGKNLKKDAVLKLATKLGWHNFLQMLYPRTLTVLNYHRIDDPYCEDFSTFKPNVSALPEMFDLQMEYLARHYNIVSAIQVAAWVTEGHPLPPRSALITFDDGYYDNYKNAYPILRKRNLPAVIFLASNFMESKTLFFWDLIAYCFHNSQYDHLEIPAVGSFTWKDDVSRDLVVKRVIEILKTLPENEKKRLAGSFPEIMKVPISNDVFSGIFLSWDQVREMNAHGIEMGAHTASHPILTRVHPHDMKVEIVKSKNRIEEEIGRSLHSFAYPNGQRTDFDLDVIREIKTAGFQTAYTLLPGPTRIETIRNHPYQIRRIFLSYKDTFPRFVAKLSGLSRISS